MRGQHPRADSAPSQALTEQPDHDNRILNRREQKHLQEVDALEVNRAVLAHLVGLELLARDLRELVGINRRRVLWSGQALIAPAGVWTRRFPTTAIGIAVSNPAGNAAVTVAAGAPIGSPPGAGAGTHTVPAGAFRVFNDETVDWTIYGTAGQVLDVQVFSIPITPAAAGAF